jgi:hypothetical protein
MHDSQHFHDSREYVVGTTHQEKKQLEKKGELPNRMETAKDFLLSIKVRLFFLVRVFLLGEVRSLVILFFLFLYEISLFRLRTFFQNILTL